jgi:hypothetical protein
MGVRWAPLVIVAALTATFAGTPAVFAQTGQQTPPPSTQSSQPIPSQSQPTINLDHIKTALSHPPAFKIAGDGLTFHLEIIARQPSFWSFVGSYDLKNGPVKKAGLTGQEYLNMVRPQLLYSSAGITAPELLQFAATNAAAQALIKKAMQDIHDARTQSEIEAIRARIDRELRALKGGGS